MNDDITSLRQELDLKKRDLQDIMGKLEEVIVNRSQYVSIRESLVQKEKALKSAKDFMEIYSLLIKEGWSCLIVGLLASFLKVAGIAVPILTWSYLPTIFTVVGAASVILFPIAYSKQRKEAKRTLKNYQGKKEEYSKEDLDSKIEALDARYVILDNNREKLIQEQRDIRELIRIKNVEALNEDTSVKEDRLDPPKVKIKK